MSRASWWRAAAVIVVCGLATRGVWLLWQYYFAGGPRHRVESTMIAVVVVGALVLLVSPDAERHERSPGERVSRASLLLLLAGSIALYSRAIGLGLLSDDYGLKIMAQSDSLGAGIGWLFRPLPLLLWRGLLAFGDTPVTLHLLNILLHGLNAFLVAVFGTVMGMRRATALGGAVLFLTFPALPEAVAWAAGVQDLLMTTMTLAAVVLAATSTPSVWRTMLICSLLILGLCSKETAVCMPVLIAVCWCSRERLTRDVPLFIAIAVVTATYLVIRLQMGVASGFFEAPTRYLFKQMITIAFGTLATPWRAPMTVGDRVMAFATATALVLLVVHACLTWRRSQRPLQRDLRLGLWVLASIAPVYTLFFIGPALEGARYLYLAASAWALVLADLIAAVTDRIDTRSPAFGAAIAVIAVVFVVSVQREIDVWRHAAGLRDRVLADARAASDAVTCHRPAFTNVPDSLNGAYVFRNNFGEALRHARGEASSRAVGQAPSQARDADCTFIWTEGRFIRSR